MARIVGGLASKPYSGGRGEIGLRFASVSVRLRGRLLDELQGLPLQRDVDFCKGFIRQSP